LQATNRAKEETESAIARESHKSTNVKLHVANAIKTFRIWKAILFENLIAKNYVVQREAKLGSQQEESV